MRKNYIKLGDVIYIPLEEDRFSITKIVYLSKSFKDMIFLRVYPICVGLSEKVPDLPLEISNDLFLYTGNEKIKREEWIKKDNLTVTEEERKKSLRIVGGEVWLEDECLRSASSEDRAHLDRMLVCGYKSVQMKVKSYLESIKLG
jgi:hypothetical protein